MKIVFMGTPDFAVPCLEALIEEGMDVAAVFTQPDKPKGRKYVLTPPPVKAFALRADIPVFQPASMRDGQALEILKSIGADLGVVVAYGKILPKEILDCFPKGCINVHASLLPKLRGAAPIQWSIVSGETETGVTTMRLDEGMDTGDMLLKSATAISDTDTAETLHDRLSEMGAALLIKTIKSEPLPEKQNSAEATYAPIISKADGLINWKETAFQINCKIRGLQPWPNAYTMLGGKIFKIFKSRVVSNPSLAAGEYRAENGAILVGCKDDTALEIIEMQIEGAKRMATSDWLRGHGDISGIFE